jgi:hypothetical protein
MMVHFRKRLGMEDMNWVQERIAQRTQKKQDKPKDTDPPGGNSGQLIVDAAVAPADTKYPTDENLLNGARKKTEAIIDVLHEPLRGEEMNEEVLHVLEAEVVKDFVLKVRFSDGTVKAVDIRPLLTGPVFAPLLDPVIFAQVAIDPLAQTVVWPNGADLAPEALHDLVSLEYGA